MISLSAKIEMYRAKKIEKFGRSGLSKKNTAAQRKSGLNVLHKNSLTKAGFGFLRLSDRNMVNGTILKKLISKNSFEINRILSCQNKENMGVARCEYGGVCSINVLNLNVG